MAGSAHRFDGEPSQGPRRCTAQLVQNIIRALDFALRNPHARGLEIGMRRKRQKPALGPASGLENTGRVRRTRNDDQAFAAP